MIDVDRATFSAGFDNHAVALRHGVSEPPELSVDHLAGVAAEVPASWITTYFGHIPLVIGSLPRVEQPASEVMAGIATNGCRLTIYHLECFARYRDLLNRCLDDITPWLPAGAHGGRRKANAFVAAPGAVVPAHFDRHHNLLLQVTGTKELFVGTFPDPDIARRHVDQAFDLGHTRINVLPPEVTRFDLGPGDGVYIPPYGFHWVAGGSEVSVALSCGFSTSATDRAEVVHKVNMRLRRVHLSPAPPGRRPAADKAKAALYQSAQRLRGSRNRSRTRQPAAPA